jgi:hypothetical protein
VSRETFFFSEWYQDGDDIGNRDFIKILRAIKEMRHGTGRGRLSTDMIQARALTRELFQTGDVVL